MSKTDKLNFPHSPGPWTWGADGESLLDANGWLLLKIRDLADDADAHVIVAGPALVLACRRVWKALMAYGPTDDGTPQGREVERAMNCVRDALLYAKHGEKPWEGCAFFEENKS